jgi:type I restriction enzyme M protein
LIVEIIEPYGGLIYDPACGSGGMFVQSAKFVEEHKRNPNADISIYGQEKTAETVRLCRMNLAVHGLSGDIKDGNTYYEYLHDSIGKFDFVMANPPFNVGGVDKEKLKDDNRFPFGLPRTDNANYFWIQAFYSALNENGRAGFVMANSASDARASELEIRRQLLQSGSVDVPSGLTSFTPSLCLAPSGSWIAGRRGPNARARSCSSTRGMSTGN